LEKELGAQKRKLEYNEKCIKSIGKFQVWPVTEFMSKEFYWLGLCLLSNED
jgi:hypothetical protein